MSKILVSIPAWEDTHLIETMRDAINKADNPKDIVFGLGLKYEVYPDLSEFDKDQIKIIKDEDINDGKPGIIGIREAIRGLITDEEYYMSIDAHADFLNGWDTKLKADIDELTYDNKKIIISRQATAKVNGQVSAYTKWSMRGVFDEFGIDGHIREDLNNEYILNNMVNDKYFKNYYISCNFIFGKTKDILNIKWPAYHRFPFEEPEQSLVLYCQGYDVVSPISGYIYHFAGNDIKYNFDPVNGYDEKWWEFHGGDRSNKSNWSKIWIVDDKEMTDQVKKLLILGENKYFSLFDMERTVRDFYNTVGLSYWYDRILYQMLQSQKFYK